MPEGRLEASTMVADPAQPGGRRPLALVLALSRALRLERVRHCHWKSNNALDRSAVGENDLDLLVDRRDVSRFEEVLGRLGFKQALAPPDKNIQGVADYFGCDHETATLVHVHAHYRLVCGHDLTKNVRLPMEDAYLRSSGGSAIFPVPRPEFEYVMLVIRLVLKHATWDSVFGGERRLKTRERVELDELETRVDRRAVREVLQRHVPWVSGDLFDACRRALEPRAPAVWAARAAGRLQRALAGSSHRPPGFATALKWIRRVDVAVRRRIGCSRKYRFVTGGAIVALVGGDGSGKTTAITGLLAWLAPLFAARTLHMGKPPWSPVTWSVRLVLKAGQLLGLYPLETGMEETLGQRSAVSPGYPFLLREACLARDRLRTFRKAQRLAARGSIVLLDRVPVPGIRLMDGARGRDFVRELETRSPHGRLQPRTSHRLARWLVRTEEDCYRRISSPDLVAVLRLDPELAVRRKPDDAPAFVRARNTEIWQADWPASSAVVLDAGQPAGAVLAALKDALWRTL